MIDPAKVALFFARKGMSFAVAVPWNEGHTKLSYFLALGLADSTRELTECQA